MTPDERSHFIYFQMMSKSITQMSESFKKPIQYLSTEVCPWFSVCLYFIKQKQCPEFEKAQWQVLQAFKLKIWNKLGQSFVYFSVRTLFNKCWQSNMFRNGRDSVSLCLIINGTQRQSAFPDIGVTSSILRVRGKKKLLLVAILGHSSGSAWLWTILSTYLCAHHLF